MGKSFEQGLFLQYNENDEQREKKQHFNQGNELFDNSKKREYNQVQVDTRQHLVDLVNKQHFTIKEAALQVDIKYSTAKHIVKTYRATGEIKTIQMIRRENKIQRLKRQRLEQNHELQKNDSESVDIISDIEEEKCHRFHQEVLSSQIDLKPFKSDINLESASSSQNCDMEDDNKFDSDGVKFKRMEHISNFIHRGTQLFQPESEFNVIAPPFGRFCFTSNMFPTNQMPPCKCAFGSSFEEIVLRGKDQGVDKNFFLFSEYSTSINRKQVQIVNLLLVTHDHAIMSDQIK